MKKKERIIITKSPKVSVIIPTYNRAHLIDRAIKTVLNQTHQDFEIIVIDDGSTDNTEEVVRSFKDKRIRYIRHERNKGAPAARNTGIKVARGKFIALLDDDDEWLPKKLEKQLEYFDCQSSDVGLIYSGYEVVDKDGNVIRKSIPNKRGDIFCSILQSNIIGSPTNLIRRECFETVGYYDEQLKSCQDWDLWIRISRKYKIDYLPEILARYNLPDLGISTNLDHTISGHIQILSKYKHYFYDYKKVYSNHLKYVGTLYGLNNDYRNGLKYLKLSIKANCFNMRAIAHYLLLKVFKKNYRSFVISYLL